MARNYSSVAEPKTLSGNVTSTATQITLNNIDGLPSPPYVLVLNPDTASEEVVLVNANQTGAVAPTLNVTRAIEASGSLGLAKTHTSGNTVKHMIVGSDLQLVHDHIDSTSAHDATGGVVGLTKAQALTNKTINLASNTVTGTKAQFNTAISDADFATLTGTEELTNKTLTSPTVNTPTITSPTISGTITGAVVTSANIVDGTIVNADVNAAAAIVATKLTGTIAEFNTALTGNDFATLAGTETLTNKTLTSPTLNNPVISGTNIISSGNIVDGTISNVDISSSAAIDKTKIAGTAITAADLSLGAWATYTPTLSGGWANGNGTWDALYTQIGKTVHWTAIFTLGTTTTKGSTMLVSLPVTGRGTQYAHHVVGFLATGGTTRYIAAILPNSTTNIEVGTSVASATHTTFNAMTATTPFTWATGDQIRLSGTYEAA